MQPSNVLISIVALAATIVVTPQSVGQQPSLNIKINNIKNNSGKVFVSIYKDQSSWLKTPLKTIVLPADGSSKTASFQVPPGKYAVSTFQDINGNGELDQNFIGIPKEPIGFGNNYKPYGKPKFESAIIEYSATAKPQEIKLFEVF